MEGSFERFAARKRFALTNLWHAACLTDVGAAWPRFCGSSIACGVRVNARGISSKLGQQRHVPAKATGTWEGCKKRLQTQLGLHCANYVRGKHASRFPVSRLCSILPKLPLQVNLSKAAICCQFFFALQPQNCFLKNDGRRWCKEGGQVE